MQGWGNPLHYFVVVWVVGGQRWLEMVQCCCLTAVGLLDACLVSSHFTHFLYATGAPLAVALMMVPRADGFAYSLGLYRPFKKTLLRDQQSLLLPQPLLVFSARRYKALFSWRCSPGLCGLAWHWDFSHPRYPTQFLSTTWE